MSSTNLRASIFNRLRSDCKTEIAACLLAVTEHRQLTAELTRRSLLPGLARAMLDHLESSRIESPTPTNLEAHAAIVATLKSISENRTVQNHAAAAANQKYASAEGPILALVRAASDSLERQIAELQAAELAFFTGFGLPGERTSVSQTAIAIKPSLRGDAFTNGLGRINRSLGDYVPAINLGDLEILFQGETG